MNKSIKQQFDLLRDSISLHEPAHVVRSRIHDTLTEYVDCHCLYPKKLVVTDKMTNLKRTILVPCGHCHYCQNLKIGGWVSRMTLHTLYCAKYAYFVTLTYRSFDKFIDIPPVLRDAYWRYDDFNCDHRSTFSPCLLRMEHFQRFMKYLRKRHGADPISFFLGAEYGSDFGRPHFHVILWSDEPISHMDIYRAWSYQIPKSHKVVSIGRVDYHDLNSNGTIVADGHNFGNDMQKCFRYVAKYLCKSLLNPTDIVSLNSRVNLFIYDLHRGVLTNDDIRYVFTDRVRHLVSVFKDWADSFADHIRKKDCIDEFKYYKSNIDTYITYANFKSMFYDYETSPFSFQFYRDDLLEQNQLDEFIQGWYLSFNPVLLRKIFRPYCNASRGNVIASKYLSTHVEEYSSGKFNLPTFDGKKLVLPSYFFRKTKEYLARYIQKESETFIDVHHASRYLCNPEYFNLFFNPSSGSLPDASCDFKVLSYYDHKSSIVQRLIRSDYSFYDYQLCCRCLAFFEPDYSVRIYRYRFNRHTHNYDYISDISYESFVQSILSGYIRFSAFMKPFIDSSEYEVFSHDAFVEDMELFIDSVFDTSSSFISLISDTYCDYMSKLRSAKSTKESLYVKPKTNLQ